MSAVQDQELSKALSEALFEKLSSTNPEMQKEAVDAVNDYTRTKMREDGFMRKIMPPMMLENDDLDRQVGSDIPAKVVDKEPDSPAAISIPFGTQPMNLYIRGDRYLVTMSRFATPRFTKDVDQLRTWIMDIRQVMSDNAIKDMLAEEDGKFITCFKAAVGSAGVPVLTSGVVQYEQISGGIDRNTLWDALKIMNTTPSRLEVHTILVNNLTIKDICKLNFVEQGGSMAEDIMKDGWTRSNYMGKEWIITIKSDLVANNQLFMFADPKFIGKNYQLEDTTMYIRREAYMLEFFAYETCGASFGHTSGLALAEFV